MEKGPQARNLAAAHDAYAADYDCQVQVYGCHLPEILFGLCNEFLQPGQRVLDLGIGTGLVARLLVRAGLEVYGMDFSPAMLDRCRAKGIGVELRLHDLTRTPWPYAAEQFDHLVSCGVLHFVADLAPVFREAGRVLKAGGFFAFTTKAPTLPQDDRRAYEQTRVEDLDVFSHHDGYLHALLKRNAFELWKRQKCLVEEEAFWTWVAQQDTQEPP